ncbi:hypothetical protein TARUN_2183 [Trichoderma arundinaceum]|uniref:Uncharacterized protein n=1 Tax=Trichoderma arundinaceum TaxID=490622 RepID=A0A395NVJ1_TRIAR|nr:hypothetical protein TARUN_2183 [Trichoderma arundinaceum]
MGTFSCSGFQPDGSPTWFACPTTNTQTTTTTTTTTTASPTTTTTTTTSPATTISSPTRPHRSNTPPTTSTALTRTPTASPNPESNATNSIPTSSQTVLPIQQHSGLSTGATAGIAIGCVAAGLIIGLLAALRRKHKDTTSVNQDVIIVESKAPSSIEATEGISSGAGIRLGQFLLDGAPDQEIVSELQSLGELICQHVEGHYSLQPVDANVQTLTQPLQSLGLGMHGSGLSTETIAALCANSYSRLLGLRYVISTVIFASIDFHSRSRLSLLPGTVAEFLQSMPPPEYGDNNQQGK